MYSRIDSFPADKSFFLFGPRGTGKTTWIRSRFPDAVYLDLLEASVFNDLLADPQRLGNYIPPEHQGWVIIDEVQKIPALLDEVHRLIENEKRRFILTGSSARKIKRQGANLLAGRALTYTMHPLTAAELGSDYDWRKSLSYGQLPSIYAEGHPREYLKSYVKTYLIEEIQQEGLSRNLAVFSRFLEAASFSQGSVLNISNVARECAVERKTVENYFHILEDLLIAVRLPVFTRKAARQLAAHPKFYFFDTGVYRAIRPAGPLDSPEEIEGHAFETLVLQELRAHVDAADTGYALYYWRTSNNTEVDFVLYGPKGILAVEVKRTGRISRSMFSGLKSFLRDYPMTRPFLVYGGDRRMQQDGIDIVPLEMFVRELPALLA